MSARAHILIVGGGIAGLGLAAALRRRGFAPDLIERDSRWAPVGGGIAVQPNAMRVLRVLGLDRCAREAGAIVRRWQFCSERGDVLCEVDLAELWGGDDPFLGIERTRLHDVLRSGLGACRLGTRVASLRRDGERVSIGFSDGTTGEYDLVVGADGIHSDTRAFVSDGVRPAYGGQMVWRSVARVQLPRHDTLQFWLGDGCFFGLCPVRGGTYGFANVTGPRFHDATEGRLARLRDRFAGFGPAVRDYLASLGDDAPIHCSPIEWLDDEHWREGRVLLIGDAAHAGSPMMGQGGSMALEDALVLAEMLDEAPDMALDGFVARRRPRVAWVRQQSRAAGELLRLPADVRNAALRERGRHAFHERYGPLVAPP